MTCPIGTDIGPGNAVPELRPQYIILERSCISGFAKKSGIIFTGSYAGSSAAGFRSMNIAKLVLEETPGQGKESYDNGC